MDSRSTHPRHPIVAAQAARELPRWNAVLRALREAQGVTREGWATWLGYSRATVARWESGTAVPTADAEQALLAQCQERSLFRAYDHGPLRGLTLTPAFLRDLLAEARLDLDTSARQPFLSLVVGHEDNASPQAAVHPPAAAAATSGALAPLPVPLTSFVGRERELAEVRHLLTATQLLTLTGPAGTGKTRLALQLVADVSGRFADGVCFVSLAAVTDAKLVLPTIARTLGVREAEGRSLVESLHQYLHARELLLVLDNFEQVLGTAPLVAELLVAAPRLRVLITTRAVLHVQAEHQYTVPPLALPDRAQPSAEDLPHSDAVRLFVERARAAIPHFAVTEENAAAIAEICHRLDGLPLAIELAAARLRLLSPQGLLARLTHRLQLLTGGARDLPARQQTLRDAINWSYDLLASAEQTLFRRLAIFAGGCTLEAVEVVCTATGDRTIDVLDGLSALMDNSLLRAEEGPAGEPRFVLLETIREYGREQLQASGEADAIRRAHATFYLQLAEAALPHFFRRTPGAWPAQLDAERDNLHAALGWSQTAADAEVLHLRLAGALGEYWMFKGAIGEGRGWLEQALTLDVAKSRTPTRALALYSAGRLAWAAGDAAVAGSRLAESAAVWEEVGDPLHRAHALYLLGQARLEQGDLEAARAQTELAVALFRAAGDRSGLALTLLTLGNAALQSGDLTTARSRYAESLGLFQERGGTPYRALLLRQLGYVALRQNDHQTATAHFAQSLTLNRESGEERGVAACLVALGGVALVQQQYERAARLLGAATARLEAADIARLVPFDQAAFDRSVAAVRAHLGEDAFAAVWAEGRALSLDEAIAYVTEMAVEPTAPSVRTVAADAALPHRLTPREVEVLRLLAAGLSNRRIAERLVVSRRTVEHHLTAIYAKIGAQGRVEAAAYALTHGLT